MSAAPEADLALIMENGSSKDITALRFVWVMTLADGQVKTKRVSEDSYLVDLYRAVLPAGDSQLITPSLNINESTLEQLLHRRGGIGSGRTGDGSLGSASAATFRIDLLLFADGEIAGPDPDRYAAELRCRKPAAEFVAQQIRLAEGEGRDCAPVLSALAEAPRLREDYLGLWVRRYARQYLQAHRNTAQTDMRKSILRHFENLPVLPKFYRKEENGV